MTGGARGREDEACDGDEHDATLRAEGVPDARDFGVATGEDEDDFDD